MVRTLLARPITSILGLCITLFGIGMISPSHAQQTSIRAYTAPISSARTMPFTKTATKITPKNTSTKVPTTAISKNSAIFTSTPILKHYSVPASLRGDGGDESNGSRGDDN